MIEQAQAVGGAFILGAASSLAASFALIYILSKIFRPNIRIADRIAAIKWEDGITYYSIKVLNMSKRDAINLRVQLHIVEQRNVVGGFLPFSRQIRLRTSETMILNKLNNKDQAFGYDRRFVTDEDIDQLWSKPDGMYLRFRLHATDSTSNLSKVFEQRYFKKEHAIIFGDYPMGNTFDIV